MIRRLFTVAVLAGLVLPWVGGCKDRNTPTVKDNAPDFKRKTPAGAPGGAKGGGAPKSGGSGSE